MLKLLIGFLIFTPLLAWGADLRIGFVADKTSLLESYVKQAHNGLLLGFEYATNGTNMLNGRKIVIIERDTQGKPDIAKAQLEAAYNDDKVDLVVNTSGSGVALAMLPVAEEAKKIFLVTGAVADSITGDKWNKYVFRTSHTSSMDAIGNATAIDKDGVAIAILAQDYAYGRDGVKAFKENLKRAKIVHEEYLPFATTDFTAGAQRLIDGLKNAKGRKIIFVIWAGAANPFKIAELDLKRHGIEVVAPGNTLQIMPFYKAFPGMEGATIYYYGIPKNPINDWFVKRHQELYKTPPDFFTQTGFASAMAIATALKATNGNSQTDALIKAMEGMTFETAKGKMIFRAEDHQALQSLYHFKITIDPKLEWAVPELVEELTIDKIQLPIRNNR